mmetsp:Transcript_39234/g.73171  ORF Transcript_39234/g.73171 Transcript_39234/m.73171 type:complete len:319 (-) Transcript_39234:8-964(-)
MLQLRPQVLDLREGNEEALAELADILRGSTDPWDVVDIFDKLREWLRRDSNHMQQLIDPRLQVDILHALRQFGPGNLEVSRLGLSVIAGCCKRNNQNAELLAAAGLVQDLKDLMDCHRTDAAVQDSACIAIWRLTGSETFALEKITQANVLPRLFRAMQDHKQNPFVQVNALSALEKLALQGVVSLAGVREAAMKAIDLHPGNIQVRRAALRVQNLRKTLLVEEEAPSHATPRSSLPVRKAEPLCQWLLGMDACGFLMDYHVALQHFQTPCNVAKAYIRNNRLLDSFFLDVGIRKLGHRRLFEKWCQEWVCEGDFPWT